LIPRGYVSARGFIDVDENVLVSRTTHTFSNEMRDPVAYAKPLSTISREPRNLVVRPRLLGRVFA